MGVGADVGSHFEVSRIKSQILHSSLYCTVYTVSRAGAAQKHHTFKTDSNDGSRHDKPLMPPLT